ncbi:copper-transporting ATPase, partial [Acinetobacter baumannii]
NVEEFDSPTGKGVTGKIDGRNVLLGNVGYMQSLGVETQSMEAHAEALRGDGATVINIAIDGKIAGLFAIADPIKPSTPD